MQSVWWWRDLEAYRDRLARYSMEELEDIYYHMDIVRYPQQYRLVLLEFERRRLHPVMSERPLPDWRWSLPAWLARCPFLVRHRPLYLVFLALSCSLLAFVLTLAALFPLWFLAIPFGALNAVAAIFYLALVPVPVYLGFAYTFRAGAKGWLMLFALAGTCTALLWFTHSDFFHRLVEVLSMPAAPIEFLRYPG